MFIKSVIKGHMFIKSVIKGHMSSSSKFASKEILYASKSVLNFSNYCFQEDGEQGQAVSIPDFGSRGLGFESSTLTKGEVLPNLNDAAPFHCPDITEIVQY